MKHVELERILVNTITQIGQTLNDKLPSLRDNSDMHVRAGLSSSEPDSTSEQIVISTRVPGTSFCGRRLDPDTNATAQKARTPSPQTRTHTKGLQMKAAFTLGDIA